MTPSFLDITRLHFPELAEQALTLEPLLKGGSDRTFHRISGTDVEPMILIRYGTAREENTFYVPMARHLSALGVAVPAIRLHRPEEGLIWMQDLGERDLWSFRNESWEVREALYASALHEVTKLHASSKAEHLPRNPPFDEALYRWEQDYFLENCLGRVFDLSETRIAALRSAFPFEKMASQLAELPRVPVHRDFQSQNIMIHDGGAYLIDFQGMRDGLAQYDLASLLFDPYVSLAPVERESLLARFGADEAFRNIFHQCALQRLMQALGAYGFLGLVKERPAFLRHIPAALASLRIVAGELPAAAPLRDLLDTLPDPLVESR